MRTHAERNAVNTPIQGTAADMIKIAMIRIHEQLRLNKLRSQLVLQVHDELVFDAFKDEIPQLTQIIRHCMQTALPTLDVPIEVGIGIGNNWLEAH
jgi:DNA polymerase-1